MVVQVLVHGLQYLTRQNYTAYETRNRGALQIILTNCGSLKVAEISKKWRFCGRIADTFGGIDMMAILLDQDLRKARRYNCYLEMTSFALENA